MKIDWRLGLAVWSTVIAIWTGIIVLVGMLIACLLIAVGWLFWALIYGPITNTDFALPTTNELLILWSVGASIVLCALVYSVFVHPKWKKRDDTLDVRTRANPRP